MLQRIEVQVDAPYQVLIGANAIAELPSHLGRLFVVVDSEVERLHGHRLRETWAGFECEWLVIPGGEGCKTLERASALYDWLAGFHVERSEHLVAVGGGALGDLVGWVAASWKRGIPFIQVPTTLLAQVDSSVGGKVAVNHPCGKNLIGAFHQPSLVLADTEMLATLPKRQLISGLAEVVKTALLAGEPLFGQVEGLLEGWGEEVPGEGPGAKIERKSADSSEPSSRLRFRDLDTTLSQVIAHCVAYKAQVVQRDPFEKGERAVLNLGHTLGHALETWSARSSGDDAVSEAELERQFQSPLLTSEPAKRREPTTPPHHLKALLHGEAITWGLKAALLLSGFSKESREYRVVSKLPVPPLPPVEFGELVELMKGDKKARGGEVGWVLLDRVGEATWGRGVEVGEVRRVWGEL